MCEHLEPNPDMAGLPTPGSSEEQAALQASPLPETDEEAATGQAQTPGSLPDVEPLAGGGEQVG